MIKKCPECDEEFEAKPYNQIYCTQKCKQSAKDKKLNDKWINHNTRNDKCKKRFSKRVVGMDTWSRTDYLEYYNDRNRIMRG